MYWDFVSACEGWKIHELDAPSGSLLRHQRTLRLCSILAIGSQKIEIQRDNQITLEEEYRITGRAFLTEVISSKLLLGIF
jgi:hypothetical protein